VTLAVLGVSCDCQPLVVDVLASGTLPAVGANRATELSYRLQAPQSGDLMVEFSRRDGREGYTGNLYLFVTRDDCQSVTDRPLSLSNFDIFSLRCSTLANSIGWGVTGQGHVGLASPARVRAGDAVKVFLYALNTPGPLPFEITYSMGDVNCRP
jgi:hypothetical protein